MLLVIGGCWLLLAPVLKGPVGKRIPTEPPDEARRLIHPAGFSIVVPPDWKTGAERLSEDWPTLGLTPMHPLPVRSSAGIYIMRYARERPRDLDRAGTGMLREIELQGHRAYEEMEVVREAAFPDEPALSRYTLYLERGEDWYVISYWISERRTELPPMVREYINTFRIEPGPDGAGPHDPE